MTQRALTTLLAALALISPLRASAEEPRVERELDVDDVATEHADAPAEQRPATTTERASTTTGSQEAIDPDKFVDPVSEQGQQARGLYFNGPMQKRLGVDGMIRAVRNARMNAVVLDIKDGEGRVTYDTKIEVLQPQKRVFVQDTAGMVSALHAAGIYVIGRVVCFSDPFLPRNDPSRAVMDNRPRHEGRIWADTGKRNTWLDPYNERNHELVAEIARDVEAFGFDEVQLDYVRFPVDGATVFAKFPAQVDKPRKEVILSLLRRVDAAISIPINVDVFGLTALRVGDPAGLGQSLEDWVPHVEVFSPMLYINGMKNFTRPGEREAERLILGAISVLRRRIGPGPIIRPYLQAFANGVERYDAEFITEQIRGARNGGSDGFLFWHPASAFRLVQEAAVGPAKALMPFPIRDRADFRTQAWREAMSPAAREAFDAGGAEDEQTATIARVPESEQAAVKPARRVRLAGPPRVSDEEAQGATVQAAAD